MTAGLFSKWQPEFAALGIATFPVAEKRPAVKNYLKAGLPASRQWAHRFGEADAFGIALKRSRLAVVDIDTTDERVLEDAVAHHGEPPFIVRTQSGGWHLYYRRTDEGRRVRPSPEQPIDVLGDGYIVAPPSRGSKGAYQIVKGTLDDLARFPAMRKPSPSKVGENAQVKKTKHPASPPLLLPPTPEGRRNRVLWEHCMAYSLQATGLDDTLTEARLVNATFGEPLPDDEVVKAAGSAWGYTERGDNWFGFGRRIVSTHDEVDTLLIAHPDAFVLLTLLRRHHWGREFTIANALTDKLGWTVRRLRAARAHLLSGGYCVEVHPASSYHGAAKYVWGRNKG